MLWKVYVWVFLVINAASLIAFDYRSFDLIGFISLGLSVALNIIVFSYAYKREIFPKVVVLWLFKANIGLFGLFLLIEFLSFIQEIIGTFGVNLPSSGVVSIIASFPSLPALYAAYKMSHEKASKSKKKSKKKA